MKRTLIPVLLAGTTLSALLFLQCSKETLHESPSEIEFRDGGSTSDLVSVSYDIDYSIITFYNCTATRLDSAASVPIVDKQRVSMTIKENGGVSLTSEDLVSQNAFTIPHNSPPNDRTEIKKTVLENGELKLFDASNNLIRSIPGQSISLPVVASELKTQSSI